MRVNFKLKLGAAILFILVMTAIFGPLSTPGYNRVVFKRSLTPPGPGHIFGTDILGRDYFGRVSAGARISLTVGFAAVCLALLIGLPLGAVAGFFGGWLETLIMRLADVFLAFPLVLGALLYLSVVKTDLVNILVALALFGWPFITRIFRASVATVKESDYVVAARVLGAGNGRLLWRHIVPNAVGPVVVYALMNVGAAVMAESILSFLGIGLQPPNTSWGFMLAEAAGRQNIAPWLVYIPGAAITLTVLAFTLIGDGLRASLGLKE